MDTHQQDIHTIIYLERIIYSSDRILLESDIISTDLGPDTPSKSDRLRVLAQYDQSNANPHHRHWHRQLPLSGMVCLTKPAPFDPF